MSTYTPMHTHTVHTHKHTHMHTQHALIHACTHTRKHTHIDTMPHTHTHTQVGVVTGYAHALNYLVVLRQDEYNKALAVQLMVLLLAKGGVV